jgi:hypothetical protein
VQRKTIVMMFVVSLAIGAAAIPVQAETLSWNAVTTYEDGSPIEGGKTIQYKAYWSHDPSLTPETLRALVSETREISVAFDPEEQGMVGHKIIYFTVKTVLDTGEESSLSETLAWRLSNKKPGIPGNGRIVRKNKK